MKPEKINFIKNPYSMLSHKAERKKNEEPRLKILVRKSPVNFKMIICINCS